MIRVSPEMDFEKVKKVCEASGARYEENSLCLFAYEDSCLVGLCLFKLIKDGVRVSVLRNTRGNDNLDALIIAGRACLEFAERTSGVHAYLEEENEALAKALCFTRKDGKQYLDMTGYFGTCQGCQHK